jgi:serine/threonine protein kinase
LAEPAEDIEHDRSRAYGDELPPGEKLGQGQYTIERYLNSGGFGITYLARDSLGRKVVIKECFPGAMCCRTNATVRLRSRSNHSEFDKIVDLFEKEARALSELQHPYIVGVHQIFHDNGTAYMALDFVEGQDLLQVINDDPDLLEPDHIKQLLIKILEAISYMHDREILHRDISPDNILLDTDGSPVLIDFGAARESATRVSRVLSKVLTVKDGYSPQEFYLAGSQQSFSSDLYALAATFYHLVSGKAPPSSHLRLAAAAKKTADPLELLGESYEGYDKHFLDAINQCLSIFPQDRLESAQAWRDMIDVERRRKILKEEARKDTAMTQRISALVSEFERDMESWEAVPQPKAKRASNTQAKARKRQPSLAPVGLEPTTARKSPGKDFALDDSLISEILSDDASSDTETNAKARPVRSVRRLLSGTSHLIAAFQKFRPNSTKEAQK